MSPGCVGHCPHLTNDSGRVLHSQSLAGLAFGAKRGDTDVSLLYHRPLRDLGQVTQSPDLGFLA